MIFISAGLATSRYASSLFMVTVNYRIRMKMTVCHTYLKQVLPLCFNFWVSRTPLIPPTTIFSESVPMTSREKTEPLLVRTRDATYFRTYEPQYMLTIFMQRGSRVCRGHDALGFRDSDRSPAATPNFLLSVIDFGGFRVALNRNPIELGGLLGHQFTVLVSAMSVTTKALRQMRIITIPLTRPRAAFINSIQNERANRILTYYQFQITSPPKPSNPSSRSDDAKDSWLSWWRPEGGVMKWVSTKAADTWAGFGKANGGWKVRLSFFVTRFFR